MYVTHPLWDFQARLRDCGLNSNDVTKVTKLPHETGSLFPTNVAVVVFNRDGFVLIVSGTNVGWVAQGLITK